MVASVSCIYGLGAPELYLQMTEEISIELTKEHIKKIKSKNDDLNAFVLLTEDLALERAAKAQGDEKMASVFLLQKFLSLVIQIAKILP